MAEVETSRDGGVLTITLNRPDVLNAFTAEMHKQLVGAFKEARDAEVRAVVVTGSGRGFCVGQDLNEFGEAAKDIAGRLRANYHPTIRSVRGLGKPVLAAVNGPAAGAGMSFALMGDMIVCARSSYFLQAFRRIGLVPDCGSTWLLPRIIGKARSVELSLMGERLPAEKALEWGLVNRVHDDAVLMEEAMKLAHDLANGPTIALSLIRKLYWDSSENSFEEQLNLEFESQRIAGSAEDFKEGVTAFLEKRPAKFKGK